MKHKSGAKILFCTLFVLACSFRAAYCQTFNNIKYRTDIADALYADGHWSPALKMYEDILPQTSNATEHQRIATQILLCLIKTNTISSTDRITKWKEDFNTASQKSLMAYYEGTINFNQQYYDKTLQCLENVKTKNLPEDIRDHETFIHGYAYLMVENEQEALALFKKASAGKDKEIAALATYYISYIHYCNKDFNKALEYLKKIEDNPKFKTTASIFALQSKYYLGDSKSIIAEGDNILNKLSPQEKGEKAAVAKILSQAWYSCNDTQKALNYFDLYTDNAMDKERADYYFRGILNYTQEDYEKSAKDLKMVGMPEDSLRQSALYYLAKAEFENGNESEAQKHLNEAAAMDIDNGISEDALYTLAKMSFDCNSDTSKAEEYIKLYKESQREKADTIATFLAEGYIANKDYGNAISMLSNKDNKTDADRALLQKAFILQGEELYNGNSFTKAKDLFHKASLASDNSTAQLAKYWEAECFYRLGKWSDALSKWKEFLSVKSNQDFGQFWKNTHFNIAYCHYNNSNYKEAAEWFRKYIALPRILYVSDAYMRLGDCEFMRRNYQLSDQYYQKAASHSAQGDYALFQRAISYGLQGKEEEKISMLDKLITDYPKSKLIAQTLYEKGQTYMQLSDYTEASQCFKTILNKEPKSNYVAKALTSLGLIEINRENHIDALKYYTRVVKEFPGTPEEADALAGIENIFSNRNDIDGYFRYLSDNGIESGKSEDEKEDMAYSSAEKLVINGSSVEAISALEKFIKKYPESSKINGAHFYLAESYLKEENTQKAAEQYKILMENGDETYLELSTLKYANIMFDNKEWQEAANAYSNLEDIATIDNNVNAAKIGQMISFYNSEQFKQAIGAAKKVVNIKDVSVELKREANYILGKSYIETGANTQAVNVFKELSKEPETPEGAEAYYLLCLDAFNNGDDKKAEELIYTFAETDTQQEYWIANCFILLGDIFNKRGDLKQAQATYQSVIDEYRGEKEDELISLAKEKCSKIDLNSKENNGEEVNTTE